MKREHWINPVLYFEYEHVNEATHIVKEVVGTAPSFDQPNSQLSKDWNNELEAKLILSSGVHHWDVSENFIVEKNLSKSEGVEFGYALGASRHLSSLASGENCRFCRENFSAGLRFSRYRPILGSDGLLANRRQFNCDLFSCHRADTPK